MTYAILLEPRPEGGFTVIDPDLRGCVSQGQTEREGETNIVEAIEGWIQTAREHGWPVPESSVRSSVVEIRAA